MESSTSWTCRLIAVALVLTMVACSFAIVGKSNGASGDEIAVPNMPASKTYRLFIGFVPGETEVGTPHELLVGCVEEPNSSYTRYRGTVAFSSTDPAAVLPEPYTFTKADDGVHIFPMASVVFNTPGLQVLTAYDVKDPNILGSVTVSVTDSRITLLSEHFDSWGSLDPHWTVWNCTNPVYNSIDVADGNLKMTNIDWPDVNDAYNSMANWTYPMTYDNLTVSFRIYLPFDDSYKEGYWGQFVAVILCDSIGTQRVIVRFLMDTWTGAPNGFTYVSQDNVWVKISGFSAGWHNYSLSLMRGSSTWVAMVDGKAYYGLTFAAEPWSATDLSKILLYNSLREEPITVLFDGIAVQRVGPPAPPPPPNTPPVAVLGVDPQIGNTQTRFAMDATGSYDKEDSLSALKARWDFESDGVWDTAWSSSMDAFHRYTVGGEYIITLEIKDTGNLTSTAMANITVDAGMPFVYAGPDMVINANTTVNFWGNDSFDPETGILSYDWAFYGDGWTDYKSGVLVQETFSAPSLYPVTVALTVTDLGGNSATDTMLVWVWPEYTEVMKGQGHPGKSTVKYSIPGHENGDWVIQFENYGLRSLKIEVTEYGNYTIPPIVLSQTIRFSDYGAYPTGYLALDPIPMNAGSVYEVEVTPSGGVGTYARMIDAFINENLPPVAEFISSVLGFTVNVDASGTTDPDGYAGDLLYVWSWGDGTVGHGVRASHTYPYNGAFWITLKAIDNAGGYGVTEHKVVLGGISGWQEPKLLQLVPGYQQASTMGMDDQGNVMVIWEQPFEANVSADEEGIWWIMYDHESSWGSPVKIWNGPYCWGYTTLAVGPSGHAVAAWYPEFNASPSNLCARIYDPAYGWAPIEYLSVPSGYGDVSAAVDRNGNAMLVIASQPTLQMTSWLYSPGYGWQKDTILSSGGAWPKVRFDGTGCALLMWNDFDTNQVKSCRYVPGSGWGPNMIASGWMGGYWVEFDVEDSGRALAVFFLHNGTAWQMYANVFEPQSGWGMPTCIGPILGGWHPFGGFVAAGMPGEFFIIWEQSTDSQGTLWSLWTMKWSVFSGWDQPVKLNSGLSIDSQFSMSIDANVNGEAIATWTETSSGLRNIVSARYVPEFGWGSAEEIDASNVFDACWSSVAIAPNGNAVAIWSQSNGVENLLWGRVFVAGGGPPVNRPPVPVITVDWIDGLTVYVDGRYSYDPDGRIVWYSWTWWDGTPPTLPSPFSAASHTYASPGNYTIMLTVTDNNYMTGTAYGEVFVTAPQPPSGNWTTPVAIGTGAAVALHGGVSMDSNANGYAVASWIEVGASQWEVYANLYVPGVGWQGAEHLGSVAEYPYFTCSGIDGAGNATVAWITGHTTLCCTRYASSARSWEKAVEIVSNAYYIEGLTLAVEVNGKAVLAWCSQEGSRWDAYASTRSTGNVWSSPVHIESSPSSAYNPSAAISEGGDAIVALLIWGYTGGDVYASYYDALSRTWYPEQLLENVTGDAKCLRASMDEYCNAFVVWDQWLNGLDTVYVNVLRRGWGWDVAKRIEPGTGYSITNPEVSAYGNCNAVVSWVLTTSNSTDIRVCRYLNGSTWSAPVTVASNCPNAWHTSVSADSLGNTFLTWSQSDGSGNPSGYFVETALWDPLQGWSAPSVMSWVTNVSGPRIATSEVGTAILVWDDFGAVANVWASVYMTLP